METITVASKDKRIMASCIASVAGTDENLSNKDTIFTVKLLVKCVRERGNGMRGNKTSLEYACGFTRKTFVHLVGKVELCYELMIPPE